MADVVKLRKQRGYIKGKLTRIEQTLEQAAATLDKEDAEVRLEKLDEIVQEFQDVQQRIIDGLDEVPAVDDTAEIEFEERVFQARATLKRIINEAGVGAGAPEGDGVLAQLLQRQMELMERHEAISSRAAAAPITCTQHDLAVDGELRTLLQTQTEILQRLSTSTTDSVVNSNKVKLPTIKLSTFDGKIEEWAQFSDAFVNTIHNNKALPNIQKFIYLRSCVSDAAARVIEDIELSDANYAVAWEQLRRRFEDSGAIKKRHIQCLFQMPSVDRESADAILQLVDHVMKHTRVLKRLGLPTDSWGDLLLYLVESKLDRVTLRAWEEKINVKPSTENEDEHAQDSSFDAMMDFLVQRCHTLERLETSKAKAGQDNKGSKAQFQTGGRSNSARRTTDKVTTLVGSVTSAVCFACSGPHLIYSCPKFLAMTVEERLREARRLRLCTNCLKNDHFARDCKRGSCRECAGRHNTLLHQTVSERSSMASGVEAIPMDNGARTACHSLGVSRFKVLMATAIVEASYRNFNLPIRVLLDSGSEANFITQATCNKLGLKRNATSEIVSGVSGIKCPINQLTNIVIKSKHSKFQFNVQCLVIPRITSDLPSSDIDELALNIPSNLRLADSEFYKRNSIDVLIGAEFFFDLLENGKIELGKNKPFLQNTKLGWVVAGPITENKRIDSTRAPREINGLHCSLLTSDDLGQTLRQFWEIENCTEISNDAWSNEETMCEQIYKDTTTRDEQGRFVVSLPIRSEIVNIGETRSAALKRLTQIERRFRTDDIYRERYMQFMREYIDLGHMSLVEPCNADDDRRIVYLPHHGVIKETSSTTKLRVVFDASNKSSTGVSLNDMLMVGPALQDELIQILLRFRFYNVALVADLEKMYRQILIRNDERDLQRILWRFSMSEPIQEYKLNTVTYGQASASFLAIRSVRQLAEENKNAFPLAAKCILNDMYVDDVISGAHSSEEVKVLKDQIIDLMNKGCFRVHGWHSSSTEVLRESKENERSTGVNIKLNDVTRTLGLVWEPSDDVFVFTMEFHKEVRSKRELLSEISRLFDPLGFLGPVVILAKILMQETWREKTDWDSELPTAILNRWNKLRSELSRSITFRVPRRVFETDCDDPILYGFCDASKDAYGACIYVRARFNKEQTARLLCSKSRVAPLKTISIPRLELCSALLLARLVRQVTRACKVKFYKIFAFTDSMIALYWIKGNLSRWKSFVANRVSEIIEVLPADAWAHVKGEENPADILSRGIFPDMLLTRNLWWSGPPWISTDLMETQLPVDFDEAHLSTARDVKVEERSLKISCHSVATRESPLKILYLKISDLTKMERILAYWLRFIYNCKTKCKMKTEPLSVAEIEDARFCLIRDAQSQTFSEELSALRQMKPIRSSSKLLSLHPFLDDKDLIRVGGRLHQAPLPFDRRHPILLPSNHILTRLLVEREHKRLLHSGPQVLLASIRRRYWPLRGRDIVRRIYHSCVWCSRRNPHASSQLMGSLPADRVTLTRPFFNCGVDFAGPIITLLNRGRGRKTNKTYVALFICFATKAIHLEAVSDLSAEAFLAALRRFIGRRGRPQKIYSDNATNFKGAQREINEVFICLQQRLDETLRGELLSEGIQWIFIPPYSPHFGGLWEAGVKSCKNLLRNVMGNSLFTFEELCTALIQVESILNSRPLCALSSDPADLEALTPGHFLVGGPITSLPETDVTDLNVHRLNRWQLVQRSFQDFWKRWAAEYISSLQGRSKWKRSQQDFCIGDLVLLRDENSPPYKWKLGRIIELHPGKDSLVRVVSVKTANNVTKRAITKLCKLPVHDENQN